MTRRTRHRRPRAATALWACVVAGSSGLLAGCSSEPARPADAAEAAVPSTAPADLPPAVQLAARAAQAQDRYYTASYRYLPGGGGPVGAARVERARGGVLLEVGSTAVVQNGDGRFRCRVTAAARGCVRDTDAARPDDGIDRMQFAFGDWLHILADQSAALSVTTALPPHGLTGTCFSVDGVAAALDPPVDPGLYCFDGAGRISALRLASGTLSLTGVAPAPSTVVLPGPVGAELPPVNPPVLAPPPDTSTPPKPGPTTGGR